MGELDLTQTFAADQRHLALEWIRISIERFQDNIKKFKIGSTGELLNSFHGELLSSAGADELKIRLAYAVQGLFVDMGVGRGMGKGVSKDQGADYNRLRNAKGKLLRHERKAKRWYSKQMRREQHALGELYSDLIGQTMIAQARAAVPTEPVQILL
jgi:hypothetical protein